MVAVGLVLGRGGGGRVLEKRRSMSGRQGGRGKDVQEKEKKRRGHLSWRGLWVVGIANECFT